MAVRTAQTSGSEFWRGWEAILEATERMWSLALDEESVGGGGWGEPMPETTEPGVAEGFGAIGVVVSGFSSLTAAMEVRYFGGDFENPNYLFFIFIFIFGS
jgi:hypothetical protein